MSGISLLRHIQLKRNFGAVGEFAREGEEGSTGPACGAAVGAGFADASPLEVPGADDAVGVLDQWWKIGWVGRDQRVGC